MRFVSTLRRIRAIGFRTAVQILTIRFMYEVTLPLFERIGIHVLPIHYSSPVPDARELGRDPSRWYREGSFAGIDFNLDGEKELLAQLSAYKGEYDRLPHQYVYEQGLGLGYGDVEACLLYAMVRHVKPRTIVEVGSGSSTLYSIHALSLNARETGVHSKMIAIEPAPRPALTLANMKGECDVEIVPSFVQDIGTDFFRSLGEGDILFIDSSHVSRLGGDVDYLYLEVLPNLNKGVIVHIHDIPFPYPARSLSWVLRRHQYYSEPALVQAFLTYNSAFRILLCASYVHFKDPEALQSAIALYDPRTHIPTALWVQKVR